MRIAVTGATGFLGGHTLRRLVEAGHEVQALTRSTQGPRAGVAWVDGALDRPASLAALVTGSDAIIHIAGVVNAPDATGFDIGNRIGTANMIAAARSARVKRFIHISSIAAREPQLSLYGASKRAAEDAVTASDLDWIVVRPPAIYGPGDTEIRDMFRMVKAGVAALPPRGRLSVIHADDLARLLVALVAAPVSRALYEPDDGMPDGWSHRDFAQALGAAVGRRVITLALPRAVVKLGARVDRMARGAGAKLTADRASYLCHPDWVADPTRHVPPGLWVPEIATPDGLKATADWYRAEGWL